MAAYDFPSNQLLAMPLLSHLPMHQSEAPLVSVLALRAKDSCNFVTRRIGFRPGLSNISVYLGVGPVGLGIGLLKHRSQ